MGLGAPVLGIICMVLQAIVCLFCLVATPIDVFHYRPRHRNIFPCYSMWGAKGCGGHKTGKDLPNKGWGCRKREQIMDAASAFAIISIIVTLVALLLSILLICKCVVGFIPGVFCIIGAITTLICWACIAGGYYKKCFGVRIEDTHRYAAGFGLMVAAWCLEVIVCVLVFIA